MNDWLRVAPQIAEGLAVGIPVVALESALVTHGFARPANLAIAVRMMEAVQAEGALPAFIAILDGQVHIGLSAKDLERLASDPTARKVSLRDLPIALAQRVTGGTTVAATTTLAHRANLAVFATGGIGGVHRDHPEDVSADLETLSRTPITVVCSGAKAILDLPRTLEYLETCGVPVIGYGCDEFPAFYTRTSGLKVDARIDRPEEAAQLIHARAALRLESALLICVPVPEADELPSVDAERAITQALREAEAAGIAGKALTPFLLARVAELTEGRARRANEALLINNCRIAARIARALGPTQPSQTFG